MKLEELHVGNLSPGPKGQGYSITGSDFRVGCIPEEAPRPTAREDEAAAAEFLNRASATIKSIHSRHLSPVNDYLGDQAVLQYLDM